MVGYRRRYSSSVRRRHRMPGATSINVAVRDRADPSRDTVHLYNDARGTAPPIEVGAETARSTVRRSTTYGSDGSESLIDPPPPTDVTAYSYMIGSGTAEDLFVRRVQEWRRLIREYEMYFTRVVESEKESVAFLEEALEEFQVPLRNEHFFMSVNKPGLQDMSKTLKDLHVQAVAQHTIVVQKIEQSVLPQIEKLRMESRDCLKIYIDHVSPIYRRLRKTVKDVEYYKEDLARSNEAYKYKHMEVDPWLLEQRVKCGLAAQAELENSLYKAVHTERERIAQWEVSACNRIHNLILSMMIWEKDKMDSVGETVQDHIEHLTTDFDDNSELKAFDEKYGPVLASPLGLTGDSKLEDYQYKYRDGADTTVLLEGRIEHEKGISRKYEDIYLVLTQKGYLHLYRCQEDLLQRGPTISLYLPEWHLTSLDPHNFFALQTIERRTRRGIHYFRSVDGDYLQHWHDAISTVISGPGAEPDVPVGGTLRDPQTASRAAAAAVYKPNILPTATGPTAEEIANQDAAAAEREAVESVQGESVPLDHDGIPSEHDEGYDVPVDEANDYEHPLAGSERDALQDGSAYEGSVRHPDVAAAYDHEVASQHGAQPQHEVDESLVQEDSNEYYDDDEEPAEEAEVSHA